jgi:hypothetical protein
MLFTEELFAHVFQHIGSALDADFSGEDGILVFDAEDALEADRRRRWESCANCRTAEVRVSSEAIRSNPEHE